MSEERKARVAEAIERYTTARIAESWKGGGDPADWPHIDAELAEARAELEKLLRIKLPDAA